MAVGTAAERPVGGRGERRSRKGVRRSSSEAPTWLVYATLALLAWVPLPIGGYAEWAAALAPTLTGLLLLAWLFFAWRRSLPLTVPLVLPLSALLVMGVAAWSVLQVTPGVLPVEWNHPIWDAARDYGLEVEGVVSLSRTAWIDALLRLLGGCGMFLLAFALARREAQARRMLYAILAIVTAYAVFGLLQELVGFRLSGSDYARGSVTSTFVNRNHFATYANLGLVIALGLMIEPLLRSDSARQGRWTMRVAQAIGTVFEERRLPLMAAVILLLAVIGSASRGGILSLAGAVAFLLALVFFAGRAKRATKAIASIATLVAGFLVVWLTGDVLLERFRVIFAADTLSEIDGRIAAWQMALDAIAQRPWLGYGHGAFLEVFYLEHGPELAAAGIYDHAHNDYLQLVAELGLPAAGALLLAYLLIWGQCLGGVFVRHRRQTYPLIAATAAVLVALHAIVDFSLLMPAVSMTFAAIFGIGSAQAARRDGRQASTSLLQQQNVGI